MRALVLSALLAGCTINPGGPTPVTARPPADPNRMPTEVLDKQDPGADTSKNPVLSRSEAHYVDPDGPLPSIARALSCGMVRCDAGGSTGGWTIGLVMLSLWVATRRRRHRGATARPIERKGATCNRS